MTNEEKFVEQMKMFDEYVGGVGRSYNLTSLNIMSDQAQEIVLSILQRDFQNLIQ